MTAPIFKRALAEPIPGVGITAKAWIPELCLNPR